MVTENEYRVLSQLAYIDFHKDKIRHEISRFERNTIAIVLHSAKPM